MTEQRIDFYEGMFLFPQVQSSDLQSAMNHIGEIMERAGAKIVSLQKWDERRLAYEIKGNKRGVYFLVYFKAKRTSMAAIERSSNLSEMILRAMFLRVTHLTQEQMEAADGRAQLADEIKLRTEQAQTREDEDDSAEAVTVETESAEDTASVER